MNITLVVAASDNNVIGKDNQLLWHLPKDMRFFKNTTWGLPIVMGRKTFESLGSKVLPGRLNLILSNQKNIKTNGAILVHSLQDAVNLAAKQDYKQLMVIGGGQIYELAMPLAHTIMLTRVHTTIEGDAFFPTLNEDWVKTESTFYNSDEKHSYSFNIECWQRK
jgi:dihydrofolate reductase